VVGGCVLLFACGFLHTRPEPASCVESQEEKRWMYMEDPSKYVDVIHYMVGYMLNRPLGCRRPSADRA
jgi:hypothetical protein